MKQHYTPLSLVNFPQFRFTKRFCLPIGQIFWFRCFVSSNPCTVLLCQYIENMFSSLEIILPVGIRITWGLKGLCAKFRYFVRVEVQGNSEKCTGAFKFGCPVIFYISRIWRKSGLISHLSIKFTKKIHIMFIYIITNIKYM